MKAPFFIFLLLLQTSIIYAQTTFTAPAEKHNELGLALESNTGGGSGDHTGFLGLQYNRWNSKNVGYRIIAGYSELDKSSGGYKLGISRDSIIQKQATTSVPMFMVGAALMAQRQFYRKIYLYAGLELRLAYGSGYSDTTTLRQSIYNDASVSVSSVRGEGTDMFFAGFAPLIGVKIVFKKIVIGTELSNTAMFESYKIHGISTAEIVAESSNINQRIFIQYRF